MKLFELFSRKTCSKKEPEFYDLLVEYCEIDGLSIERVLNTDLYFAIRNSGEIADYLVARELRKKEIEDLHNNKLTKNDIEKGHWTALKKLDGLFRPGDVTTMIAEAKQKGFHYQCPECHAVMDHQALFCSHCGKAIEKDDEATRMQYTFQQLHEALTRDAQLERLKTKLTADKDPVAASDFFVHCGTLDDVQIVRLLDFDVYFAVMNTDGIVSTTIVYYMNKFEIKRLLSGEETIQSLREKPWEWQSLKSYEATNDSETMEILLKRVQKNVYTQVCPKCFAHTDFHSRFCPHCGTFIRDNKLLSQKVIDSCVTKLEVKKTNAVPSQENISSKATDTGSAQDTGELSENILLNDYSHGSTLAGIWVYKTYYYALPRIIEYSTYHIADYPDPESDRCLRVSVPDNIKTKKDLEEFARTQRPSWY